MMFRIIEIKTLAPPKCYTQPEGLRPGMEVDDETFRRIKKVARYQNVMKVLKPDRCFRLVSPDLPPDFFTLPELPGLPPVNISAIVGENGMGKSSLVDLMIRLINNTVYALKAGLEKYEEYHLRYVDDIFASMTYETDNGRYTITQEGNLMRFEKEGSSVGWKYDHLHHGDGSMGLTILPKDTSRRRLKEKAREMLAGLFYTISTNYSAYGNNVKDLMPEYTEDYELEEWEAPDNVEYDTRIWMHGIFHKNDAYQLPLVLTPYRSSGNINYNNELDLNRDRLCRLALLDPSPLDDVVEGKRPYSIVFDINNRFSCYPQFSKDNVRIVSPRFEQQIRWSYVTENRDYSREAVMDFGHGLLKVWSDVTGIDLIKLGAALNNKSRGDGDRALSYLAYKTIKIPATYVKYRKEWYYRLKDLIRSYLDGECDEEAWKSNENLIRDILADSSHITLKLRRVLAQLIFQHYTTDGKEVELRDLNVRIEQCVADQDRIIKAATSEGCQPFVHLWKYEELMPSPAVKSDVRFMLKDGGRVDASTLSSGERQMVSVLSATVYHIYNLYSLFQEDRPGQKAEVVTPLRYPYINLIYDEAELYFHPKYQTQFIKALLTAIAGLRLSGTIMGINMIFATHSPFLLSDIPKANVMCIRDGEQDLNRLERTFCANVYDILANNFFMTRFIGDFAVAKVQHIIERIGNQDIHVDSAGDLKKEIEMIGDDFVRMNLLGRYESETGGGR